MQHRVLLAILTTPMLILVLTHCSGDPQKYTSSTAVNVRVDTPLTRSEKVRVIIQNKFSTSKEKNLKVLKGCLLSFVYLQMSTDVVVLAHL